jgi:hypothetical protein
MRSALLWSEFYTRRKRFRDENISIYDSEVKLSIKRGISSRQLGHGWTYLFVRFYAIIQQLTSSLIFLWKNIPQANRTCGLEISTGQTKYSLVAGHRTTGDRYNKIVKHYYLSREINSVITPLFHCRKGHLIRGELPVLYYPQVKRILLFEAAKLSFMMI